MNYGGRRLRSAAVVFDGKRNLFCMMCATSTQPVPTTCNQQRYRLLATND